MTKESESRKYPRLAASQIVHLRKASQVGSDFPFKGVVENISLGGAFIEEIPPWQPCSEGTLVEFDVHLPNHSKDISVVAVVRRWETMKKPNGIGVEFVRANHTS